MSVRLAALGGVAFFVLILIGGSALNGAPSATDSGQEIFDFVTQNKGQVQLSAVLMGLAMSSVLLFLSGLVRALRRAEGGTSGLALATLGGGVLAATSTVTGALIGGTMASRIDELGPAGARFYWTMALMSFGATLLGLLLVIGTTAIICLQTQLFARWFAAVSVVLAFASVVGAFTIGYATAGTQIVAGITIILDTVWILLVSIFLWRDPALALP
jgi:hypothetical protein